MKQIKARRKRTFLAEVDVAVSGEDVEQTVEESVDEENEADEERTQQYSRRAAPLIQQQAALTDPADSAPATPCCHLASYQ